MVSSLHGPDETIEDDAHILAALARVWLAGVEIDWSGFHAGEQRRRIPLPTYPFERRHYWYAAATDVAPHAAKRSRHRRHGRTKSPTAAPIDATGLATDATMHASDDTPRTRAEQSVAAIYEEVLGVNRVGRRDDFFLLGGSSLLMVQAVGRLNDTLDLELTTLDFLGAPTVERLAQCVEKVRGSSSRS